MSSDDAKYHDVVTQVFAYTHQAAVDALRALINEVPPGAANPFVDDQYVKVYPTCTACIAELPTNDGVSAKLSVEIPHMGESRERAVELAISYAAYNNGFATASALLKVADDIQKYLSDGTVPDNGLMSDA